MNYGLFSIGKETHQHYSYLHPWMGTAVGEAQLTDRGGIWGVEIYHSYRRKGWGSKLILALCQAAKNQGLKSVHLKVKIENTAAIALYSKLGFRVVEVYKLPQELFMEKEL